MKKTFRKLAAKIKRTFVADCPLCHRHFYGNKGYQQNVTLKNAQGQEVTYRYLCERCLKPALLE